MFESYSSFTDDQLKFIGQICVIFAIPFIGFVWKEAKWRAKVEYDLANLGEKCGTEKGMDLAPKLREKRKQKQMGGINMEFLKNNPKLTNLLMVILGALLGLGGYKFSDNCTVEVKDKPAVVAPAPAPATTETK